MERLYHCLALKQHIVNFFFILNAQELIKKFDM